MNRSSSSSLPGLAATVVALLCLTAHASNPCQPVFNALDKVMMTPRHTYSTITLAFAHAQPRASETIVANGKVYIRGNGKWRPGLTSLQDMQLQQKERRRHATEACQFMLNELVDTEAAAVFSIQTESENSKEDGQLWISKSTGLPLRDEQHIEVGGTAGMEHISTQFEYVNIQPPM